MDDLRAIVVPLPKGIASILETLRLSRLCVEVNATICAKADLAPHQLRHMLAELDAVRSAADFDSRPAGDRQAVWQALSITYQALGDRAMVRTALNERRKLVPTDSDWLPMTLLDALNYSESAEERLGVVVELSSLADEIDLGPVFSRERIGLLSVLSDALWDVATGIDESDPRTTSLVDECFACYEKWLFGTKSSTNRSVVRIATSWGGDGRIVWQGADQQKISSLAISPDVVTRLFASTAADRGDPKPISKAIDLLNEQLAPSLADAIRRGAELRIQGVGPISLLPILATSVDGRPIGASANVARLHPNPSLTAPATGSTDPYSLLVVDRCFDRDSAAVIGAIKRAGDTQVLAFNSKEAASTLDVADLVAALQSASSAVLFCHAESSIVVANDAHLVLGPNARFTALCVNLQ